MLQNEDLLSNIGFDTAENEPFVICLNLAKSDKFEKVAARSSGKKAPARGRAPAKKAPARGAKKAPARGRAPAVDSGARRWG